MNDEVNTTGYVRELIDRIYHLGRVTNEKTEVDIRDALGQLLEIIFVKRGLSKIFAQDLLGQIENIFERHEINRELYGVAVKGKCQGLVSSDSVSARPPLVVDGPCP